MWYLEWCRNTKSVDSSCFSAPEIIRGNEVSLSKTEIHIVTEIVYKLLPNMNGIIFSVQKIKHNENYVEKDKVSGNNCKRVFTSKGRWPTSKDVNLICDVHVINAMFTLDVCVYVCLNVTVKFNIVSMENAQNGFRPILCVCVCVSIDAMVNLMVTLTQTQTQTSSVNIA